MSVPINKLMIKAFFIAAALTASGGMASVYAQAQTPSSPSGDAVAAPAGNAAPRASTTDTKKSSDVEVRREELGKKLLKRKVELDNDKPNIPSAQAPDRARERQQEPQADQKGQKK